MNTQLQASTIEFFKYRPKTKDFKPNNPLCPSELIGKVPLDPVRTSFKFGIYLTYHRGVDSRYLEDALSLGYTPFQRCLIDYIDLNQNYILVDNENFPLPNTVNTRNITRVWPAFGQIGGASEIIAIPTRKKEDIMLQDLIKTEDLNACLPKCNWKCLDCLQAFEMNNATRFQLFKADSVSRPVQVVLYNYILLLQVIIVSGLFNNNDNVNNIFPQNLNKETFAYVRVTGSGIVIKSSTRNITLSAGIREMKNFFYTYVIGSEWSDEIDDSNSTRRCLRTTKPIIFHSKCPLSKEIRSNYFKNTLKKVIDKIINDILNSDYETERSIRLPQY